LRENERERERERESARRSGREINEMGKRERNGIDERHGRDETGKQEDR
jgi:hypothetical protein